MIKLFGCPNTRSLRAVWALEECGAPYEYVLIDLKAGAGRNSDYLSLNPTGKVPTLIEGDFVLSESAAICTYIGDRHPNSGIVPAAGTRERALYDKWCFYAIGELEQPLWTMAKHRFALPEKHRVPAVIETAQWEFRIAAKALERQIGEGPFILGERFSCADILIAHSLAWAKAYQVPHELEALSSYAERCAARPAFARARARESLALAAADRARTP